MSAVWGFAVLGAAILGRVFFLEWHWRHMRPKREARVAQYVIDERRGCWCETERKPCPYHEGFEDGMFCLLDKEGS